MGDSRHAKKTGKHFALGKHREAALRVKGERGEGGWRKRRERALGEEERERGRGLGEERHIWVRKR